LVLSAAAVDQRNLEKSTENCKKMETFSEIAVFKRKAAAARHGIQFLVLEVIQDHPERRQKR
jgi:hypothetical protein